MRIKKLYFDIESHTFENNIDECEVKMVIMQVVMLMKIIKMRFQITWFNEV